MSQPLPYDNVRFLNEKERDLIIHEFMTYKGIHLDTHGNYGFAIECDLSFPEELKHIFELYPPLAEKRVVSYEELSPHTKEIGSLYGVNKNDRTGKLITCLSPKKHYHIFARNLILVLSLGISLDKIYNVVTFRQKPWLKEYIDLNTRHRSNSTDAFSKSFFKLLNNS